MGLKSFQNRLEILESMMASVCVCKLILFDVYCCALVELNAIAMFLNLETFFFLLERCFSE